MEAPSQEELDLLQSAGRTPQADLVVRWQSSFGLIIIEARGGRVYVNGELVEAARGEAKDDT